MLNKYIYHHLPYTCSGVYNTVFAETIALLVQELYTIKYKIHVYFTLYSTFNVTILHKAYSS